MARQPRCEQADGIFHVATRGVEKRMIFLDEDDRRTFLALFFYVARRFEWRTYAFCLMGTHYHLVLETSRGRLSAGVQWLNGSYAQAFNRRHVRRGHLFGARFASWVVDRDEHLARACRYVLNNPVRAGLVERAGDWRWSGSRVRRTYVRQLD